MGRSAEHGATLVELLIAMLLLVVAIVGLGASLPLALSSVVVGGRQAVATLLAQQALELAKSTPYSNLSGMDSGGFVTVPESPGFERAVAVQPGAPTAGATTVTVTVRFADAHGTRETTLAVILADA